MSEYIASVKQWREDVLQTYNESISNIRINGDKSHLDEWKRQMTQFHRDVTEGNLTESDIYNRANTLYEQITSFLENNGYEYMRSDQLNSTVPIGGHTLPPLPYAYDALEPYIHSEIMRLHHQKHHQSYVDGLNKAEKEMQKARNTNNFDLIKHWEREAAFNGAGHYLHTIFWNIMSPNGGGKPSGDLLNTINTSFGSFQQFKNHFSEAANKVEAVGWAILVWSPRSRRLEILQAEKHQNLSQWDVIPILVLDVWEHAYYLQYKNERKKYIEAWWNVVNWTEAGNRFDKARQLKWQPY